MKRILTYDLPYKVLKINNGVSPPPKMPLQLSPPVFFVHISALFTPEHAELDITDISIFFFPPLLVRPLATTAEPSATGPFERQMALYFDLPFNGIPFLSYSKIVYITSYTVRSNKPKKDHPLF